MPRSLHLIGNKGTRRFIAGRLRELITTEYNIPVLDTGSTDWRPSLGDVLHTRPHPTVIHCMTSMPDVDALKHYVSKESIYTPCLIHVNHTLIETDVWKQHDIQMDLQDVSALKHLGRFFDLRVEMIVELLELRRYMERQRREEKAAHTKTPIVGGKTTDAFEWPVGC